MTDPPYSKREKGIVFDADSVPSGIESKVSNSVAVNSREKNREKKKIRDEKEREDKEKSMGGREGSGIGEEMKNMMKSDKDAKATPILSSPSFSSSTSTSTSTSTSAPPSEMMGDAFATTSCLFSLASHRLKQG